MLIKVLLIIENCEKSRSPQLDPNSKLFVPFSQTKATSSFQEHTIATPLWAGGCYYAMLGLLPNRNIGEIHFDNFLLLLASIDRKEKDNYWID